MLNPNLTDQLFALRDENIGLKKQITESADGTKKLLFKIQKLSTAAAKAGATIPRTREDREQEEFIEELKSHVQTLNHNNTQLKTKMQYFRTLYESENKKRTPYMHIPPRIETGMPRRNSGGDKIQDRKVKSSPASGQEINATYRKKLEAQDMVIEQKDGEHEQARQLLEQSLKNADIDRMALQHELNETKRRLIETRSKAETLEEQQKNISVAYKEICVTIESLGKDLQEERRRNAGLEADLQKNKLNSGANEEMQIILDDLQSEKNLLEVELAKMIESQFSTQRDDEFLKEIADLKQSLQCLDKELKHAVNEKKLKEDELLECRLTLTSARSDAQAQEAKAIELQHQLELLQSQLQNLSKTPNNQPSAADIEEAFALLRLKREAGLNFEFLANWQQMEQDNQAVHELRRQYAECAQELEKTLVMLDIEHKINDDFKIEIQKLKSKISTITNEYELRLEEFSRLNDARKHKIESLEQHLRAMGQNEIPHHPRIPVESHLKGGANLMTITIHAAVLSSICSNYICENNPELSQMDSIVTFVCMDFYNFQTEVSSIGIGMKPIYNHKSKFSVILDDFLLHYLQTGKVSFQFCYSNGLEYYTIGTCAMNLSQLISPESKKWKFVGDVYSKDSKSVLGCLEYSIEMAIPVPLAVKAFKERTIALNLSSPKTPNSSHGSINNLHIEILDGQFQNSLPAGKIPRIFGIMNFEPANHGIVLPTVEATYHPNFKFETIIPLKVTNDLERYLRTSKMLIIFADEVEKDWVYGYCKLSLVDLVHGKPIDIIFDIENSNGVPNGTLRAKFFWDTPYKSPDAPMISLLDDQAIRDEIMHVEQRSLREKKTDVSISISKLLFDPSKLAAVFQNVQQLFVSCEFLGLKGEKMESPSLLLPKNGEINIELFKSDIPFTEILASKQVAHIKEDRLIEQILFCIVDEPPAEAVSAECRDIATASLSLTKLISDKLEGKALTLPVFSRETNAEIGSLEILVTGFSDFYSSIDT